ncbi:MAG TPA: dihydroxyacetone kinase subunit DhaK [Acetobacteraceae bacterium]|nr:dihydroxyacetone kinase subunit DhaK [Acetobacteraceae bacterium]
MTKKLINEPHDVIEDMLAGIVAAHPGHVRLLPDSPRSLVSIAAPRPGKVGIVVGGGSGHEPAFLGYVGRGIADAAAVGNPFASPGPEPIVEATKAVHGGAGVLYLYGNYAGDVMNFDMAAELCAFEDIAVRTVLVTDDVASAPREEADRRRGVAGGFFVFKAAGAAADLGRDLDGVEAAARHANALVRTMGVALEPCSLPATRTPNFNLGPDEIELGIGIHGEPGVEKGPMRAADAVADEILDRVMAELHTPPGSRVAVLVNGMGATPLMELYVIARRVLHRLADRRIGVHRTFVGNFVTALEMAGCSISLLVLDDELTTLLDHPADCVMFRT